MQLLYRSIAIIEKFVERNSQCPCILPQSLNRGNGMTILHTGCIASEQSRPLFDIALTEILRLSDFFEFLPDDHVRNPIPLSESHQNSIAPYLSLIHI